MKLTKNQTKMHDEALAIASLTRALSNEEKEFVLEHYNPMATHNVGKNAIFFTPPALAESLAMWAEPKGTVIDLCSGIGMLSYYLRQRDQWSHEIKRIVCVEIDQEFVEVGKKILPEAEWYCGSVFDLDLMRGLGQFDTAISNPPYGQIAAMDQDWMLFKGPAHFMVAEIALRIAHNGGEFIIPETDCEYDLKRSERRFSGNVNRLKKCFPGVTVWPESEDFSIYEDMWDGASPKVVVASINYDPPREPIGFPSRSSRLVKKQSLQDVLNSVSAGF